MESTDDKIAVPEKARLSCLAQLSLEKVLFWICLCLVLFFIFWPMRDCPDPRRPDSAVAARGKDIYVAITSANVDREPLGMPSLWPKTYLANTNHPGDISSKVFTTSTDYFYELYSGPNTGIEKHDPYVKGFDYYKLSGAGVPHCPPGQPLTAQNNMWAIAANITDFDDDIIPLLITRNVDVKVIEWAINHGITTNDFKRAISLGTGECNTPFGGINFLVIRKGGGIFNCQSRYATLGTLFGNRELPPRDPSKPPIVYLMP